MRFNNINFNNGEMYYVGETRQGYRGYEPDGIGVMKWVYEKKIVMCNIFTNDGINGLGFEYYNERRYGSMSTYIDGKFFGPTMSFGYEKYLVYENYDYNERPYGFSVYVYYDGSYIIYEESNNSVRKGVCYYDGYLYFVEIDRNMNILSRRTIQYVGSDYAFSAKRMFCMNMDETKEVYNKSGRTTDGYNYDLCAQLLSQYSTNYFGYGAIKWDDGSSYFGEFVDSNRDGLGCYVESDGTKYMGKFYQNKRSGNGLIVYDNGVTRMGSWSGGKREGISFEIGEDYVVIINYVNDKVYGNKFQVYKGVTQVSEFNSSGTIGRHYW